VRRIAEQPAHALAFDGAGALYVGRQRAVQKITPDGKVRPFATLELDQGETPMLWALRFGPDGALYGAAHDRIVRISSNGAVETLIEKDFPGPCGATDLDFDEQGAMYVAYADKLARYTLAGAEAEKTVVLDGAKTDPVIRWLVAVRVDRRSGDLYVSDVRSKRIFVCRSGPSGMLEPARVANLPEHPEYFALAPDGRAFVGFPSADAVMRVDELAPPDSLQRLGDWLTFPASLSFGDEGFDRSALYAACRDGIYEIRVGGQAR
jgi:hypothetical protein